MARGNYDDTGFYRDWIAAEGEHWRRERDHSDHEKDNEMRDTIRRSFRAQDGERAAAEKAKRMEQVSALVDAWRRGGIAVDRALTEIVETARGDATAVVRVGEQVRPDITTGEKR